MQTLYTILFYIVSFFYFLSTPLQSVPILIHTVYQRTIEPHLLKPIKPNKYYYKHILGDIYYARHPCFDVLCSRYPEFTKLNVADPKTFTLVQEQSPEYANTPELNFLFAKDRKHVYNDGAVVSGAEPNTFHVIRGVLGKDKFRYYFMNQSLADMLHRQFPSNNLITPGELDVISYAKDILLIKQNEKYFLVNPFDIYTPIRQISLSEANTYPKLVQ